MNVIPIYCCSAEKLEIAQPITRIVKKLGVSLTEIDEDGLELQSTDGVLGARMMEEDLV